MTVSLKPSADNGRWYALIRFLRLQSEALSITGASPELRQDIAALIAELRKAQQTGVLRLFETRTHRTKEKGGSIDLAGFRERIARLSLFEIEAIVVDENTTRQELEEIAVTRFSYPRGSLSSLGKKSVLTAKILSLIRNEQAHATISRLARPPGD